MAADGTDIGRRAHPCDARRDAILRPAGETRRDWQIDVHNNLEPLLSAWAELEAVCPASIYQTQRWLTAWIATVGRAAAIEPLLIVGSRDGAPVVFFPFGVVRRGGLRIAEFLGGKDSNSNIGLFRPGANLTRLELRSLFAAAAAKASVRPDLFVLSNQPERWENFINPVIATFSHQPSPSYCHRSDLEPEFEPFLRRHLSKDGRKKLHRKQKRLLSLGPVVHLQAKTRQDVARILDAFIAQKEARLANMGVTSAAVTPAARAFLETIARRGIAGNEPAIELHALKLGDRIVATFGGGSHRGRFHGMINSFDPDPEIARCSPGELLLAQIVEEKCSAAFTSFDLGIGEARYKDTWCDIAEPLFDTFIPVSMKGHVAAVVESVRRRAKRAIKQNDRVWSLAKTLRAQ